VPSLAQGRQNRIGHVDSFGVGQVTNSALWKAGRKIIARFNNEYVFLVPVPWQIGDPV
jgi:hypothetical protein